ncbi:hypothetical protein, partial [Clostridioides difficile]
CKYLDNAIEACDKIHDK